VVNVIWADFESALDSKGTIGNSVLLWSELSLLLLATLTNP
jgi:hypothetical protein